MFIQIYYLFTNQFSIFKNKSILCDEQYLTGGYILLQKGCQILINMYFNCLYSVNWMSTRLRKYNHFYSFSLVNYAIKESKQQLQLELKKILKKFLDY